MFKVLRNVEDVEDVEGILYIALFLNVLSLLNTLNIPNMYTYAFEKLDVWQRGRELNKQVYDLSKLLPNDEKFGITSQIRRASISVTCNLAEGSGRTKGKEQARFSEIAYSSLMEVLNLLITCVDLNYIQQLEIDKIRPLIGEISHKVNALRISQLKKHLQQKAAKG